MTISTTTNRVDAPGNGSATAFSFAPVVIFKPSDLQVTIRSSTGVETAVTQGAGSNNYSVTVGTYPGTGSIIYPASGGSPLPSGSTIVIKRIVPVLQSVSLGNQGAYFPKIQEGEFDYLTAIDQQQQEQINRTVQVAATDPAIPILLPTSAARASQFLGFDSLGNPIAALPAGTVPISTAMAGVVGAASHGVALQVISTPTDAQFGVPAFGVGTTGNQNCIIGQVVNNLPTNTEAFPTGVTGYANITTNAGNQAFGVFGRCDLSTVGVKGTAIGAEFNAFNKAGDPNGQFPPNAGIGTDDYVAIACQVASYGDYDAKIGFGVMYGGVPAGGQPFKVGYYVSPGASRFYSMLLDATGAVGPANGGALIRSTGVEPNLILQTQSLPTPANAVFTVIDHLGTVHAYINQGGQGIFAGTATNDDAPFGVVGEYLPATLAFPGSGVTSGSPTNIVSLPLNAGDYDVSGSVGYVAAGTTVPTSIQAGISKVSGTLPSPPGEGGLTVLQQTFATGGQGLVPVGTVRIKLAAPATIYLVANIAFTTSTLTAYGFIRARRMR